MTTNKDSIEQIENTLRDVQKTTDQYADKLKVQDIKAQLEDVTDEVAEKVNQDKKVNLGS